MIKIAVCDDNPVFLKEQERIIRHFYQEKLIQAKQKLFENSELLLFEIHEKIKYDLYILDIDMPKVNGIRLAKEIREYDKEAYIVFITSHLKYSVIGYEYNVYRYIPKTMISEKLVPTLESVTNEILLKADKYFIISTISRYEKVAYKEIYYIYKEGKNSVFVCSKSVYRVRKSLKQVYEELDCSQFIFIERGYIVNITMISKTINNEMYLVNGEVLRVGGSYAKEVKQKIAVFWSENV